MHNQKLRESRMRQDHRPLSFGARDRKRPVNQLIERIEEEAVGSTMHHP